MGGKKPKKPKNPKKPRKKSPDQKKKLDLEKNSESRGRLADAFMKCLRKGSSLEALFKELEVFEPALKAARKTGDQEILKCTEELVRYTFIGDSGGPPSLGTIKEMAKNMLSALENRNIHGFETYLDYIRHSHDDKGAKPLVNDLINAIESYHERNSLNNRNNVAQKTALALS